MSAIRLYEGVAPGALGTGEADSPRMWAFPIKEGAARGAVVVLPGGGYEHLAGDYEGADIARWLNGLGIAAFVVHYRIKPYRHPVELHDAQRAIRLVRARAGEFNVDPKRVGIMGFSAGGHLAASASCLWKLAVADELAKVDPRPSAAILCYPVITFGEHGHGGSMRNLIGENPEEGLRKMLSLENSVTAQTPPTFVWHTAEDQSVPLENALMYAAALKRNKVPVELHVFAKGGHGMGMAVGHEAGAWTGLAAGFLRRVGF